MAVVLGWVLRAAWSPGVWLILTGAVIAGLVFAVEQGWIDTPLRAALHDTYSLAVHDAFYQIAQLHRLYLIAGATAALGAVLLGLRLLPRLRGAVGLTLLWGAGGSFLAGIAGFIAPALDFIARPEPRGLVDYADLIAEPLVLGFPAGDWPFLGGVMSAVFLLFAVGRGLLWRL